MSRQKISIVVPAAFLAIFILPLIFSMLASLMYNSSQFGAAKLSWKVAELISYYDKGQLIYNQGNAEYMLERYEQAATKYEEALISVTDLKSCQIRYNWARAEEKQGDALAETDVIEAIKKYSKGLWVLTADQCFENEDYKESFASLEKQIRKKLDDLLKKQKDDSKQDDKDGKETDDSKKAEEIVKDSTQEIEQKLQIENQKRYDQFQESNGNGGGSGSFPDLQW